MIAAAMRRLALVLLILTLSSTALAQTKRSQAKRNQSGTLSAEEIATRAEKAVVLIECRTVGETTSFGSGFVVDRVGLIATNAHVVTAACDEVSVSLGERGSAQRAILVSLDADRDVAMLVAPSLKGSALPLGTSQGLRPGQKVFAMGHPEGLSYSFSDGLVSAIRDLPAGRYIQFTAAVSPGSSGGPLLNNRGQVIGMTTGQLTEGQNLNFAVSAEVVAELSRAASIWLGRHPVSAPAAAGEGHLGSPAALPPLISAQSAARLSRSFRKAKNYGGAKAVLDAGLERFPDSPDLLLQCAELNWDQEQFGDSMAAIKRLLEVAPDSPYGHECMSAFLYRLGRIAEAREEGERCLALNPDAEYRARAHQILADCAATNKDFATAAGHLGEALEYPEIQRNPVAHVHYAVALLQAGRVEKADSEARVAASLGSTNLYVRELLKTWRLPRGAGMVSFLGEWDFDRNFFVKGIVTNEGSQSLQRVRVKAELRDPKNTLIGTGQGFVEPEILGPRESGSFRILVQGAFNAPAPARDEPFPDVLSILGPRPVVPPAPPSDSGAIVTAFTVVVQTRQISAQHDWDAKRAELIQQWEAKRQAASKPATTGNTYIACIASD